MGEERHEQFNRNFLILLQSSRLSGMNHIASRQSLDSALSQARKTNRKISRPFKNFPLTVCCLRKFDRRILP